ncbi:hypothetical protein SNE40_014309 [Patella caerulea]|uniref:Uncharacterized protein n=1 Tax=Patella caerulea TaxID=87958 RepID=A0AAN8PSS5_PATCE
MMEAVKYIEKHTQWHQGSKNKVNSIITVNNDVLESDIAAVLNIKELEAPRIHIFSTESELQGTFIAFDSVFPSIAKAGGVMAAVLKLLATYYMFDLAYPKPFSMVLGIMQTFVMEEPYKKETSKKYKTFIKSLRSIYN